MDTDRAEELRKFIKENVSVECFVTRDTNGFGVALKIREANGTYTEFAEDRCSL